MALSLKQARLCLDCDCLTDDVFCPWCDRGATVPIAGWFRPMEVDASNASRQRPTVTPLTRKWVLVVEHHQRELYRVLRQALAGTGVNVVYERRVGQRRRKTSAPATGERRRVDRRRPRPNAVVYKESATVDPLESVARPDRDRQTVRIARRRRQPASV
jgi:hypothetical protein